MMILAVPVNKHDRAAVSGDGIVQADTVDVRGVQGFIRVDIQDSFLMESSAPVFEAEHGHIVKLLFAGNELTDSRLHILKDRPG